MKRREPGIVQLCTPSLWFFARIGYPRNRIRIRETRACSQTRVLLDYFGVGLPKASEGESPRTPAAASGAGFGGCRAPIKLVGLMVGLPLGWVQPTEGYSQAFGVLRPTMVLSVRIHSQKWSSELSVFLESLGPSATRACCNALTGSEEALDQTSRSAQRR